MTALLEKIEREAKELSREERERLASDLIAGLEDATISDVDQAWIDEAERRYDEWKAGRTTAVPVEHASVIGVSPERLSAFTQTLLRTLAPLVEQTHAWGVLPSHYHALLTTPDVLSLLAALGRLHGRSSHEWNGEDGQRGRQVWCKAAETSMKSERHFWATMNYVHNNPVRHRIVKRWQDWPFGSASDYLDAVGTDEARRVWQKYPIGDYGKEWDPVENRNEPK